MIKYTTKRNANGNRYTLVIDLVNKTIKRGYNTSFSYSDFITVTKKELDLLASCYELNGFTRI